MARKKRTDSRGRVLRVGESQNKQGRYCYRWTEPVTGKRGTVYAPVSYTHLDGTKPYKQGVSSHENDLFREKQYIFMAEKSAMNRRQGTPPEGYICRPSWAE